MIIFCIFLFFALFVLHINYLSVQLFIWRKAPCTCHDNILACSRRWRGRIRYRTEWTRRRRWSSLCLRSRGSPSRCWHACARGRLWTLLSWLTSLQKQLDHKQYLPSAVFSHSVESSTFSTRPTKAMVLPTNWDNWSLPQNGWGSRCTCLTSSPEETVAMINSNFN